MRAIIIAYLLVILFIITLLCSCTYSDNRIVVDLCHKSEQQFEHYKSAIIPMVGKRNWDSVSYYSGAMQANMEFRDSLIKLLKQ